MKIKDVTTFLDQHFRPELQEDYDNAGFLIGNAEAEYSGSLVAVDLTPAAIEFAREEGLNLIVTHHPFIFGGVKRITPTTETGRMIIALIKNDIAVYAAHTNLDSLLYGVNGALADVLGLEDRRILQPHADDATVGMGLIGSLPTPTSVSDFLAVVKERLSLPVVRVSHFENHTVRRVAVCGGSGSFLIGEARRAGADILLTADLKYHDFQRATEGIIIADIGHFESEQFSKNIFYSVISQNFPIFACRSFDTDNTYIQYI